MYCEVGLAWIFPLPKVLWPTRIARPLSCNAPAKISLALALPSLTYVYVHEQRPGQVNQSIFTKKKVNQSKYFHLFNKWKSSQKQMQSNIPVWNEKYLYCCVSSLRKNNDVKQLTESLPQLAWEKRLCCCCCCKQLTESPRANRLWFWKNVNNISYYISSWTKNHILISRSDFIKKDSRIILPRERNRLGTVMF